MLPNLRKQISLTCLLSISKISQTKHWIRFILIALYNRHTRRACIILVRKPHGKGPLGRPRKKYFGIKMMIRNLRSGDQRWMERAQGCVQSSALVSLTATTGVKDQILVLCCYLFSTAVELFLSSNVMNGQTLGCLKIKADENIWTQERQS
jgi:hypothetical protein